MKVNDENHVNDDLKAATRLTSFFVDDLETASFFGLNLVDPFPL